MATDDHFVGELQIAQDITFERHIWTAQRIGWVVMLLVAIATLLGVFGRGWLSQASVGANDGSLRLHYERVTRLNSTTRMRVTFGPSATTGDTARVWFSRAFMQSFQVLRIEPQPAGVQAGPRRLTYAFPISKAGDSTAVEILVQPRHPWAHSGQVGLPGRPGFSFSQFVYP